jgi:nitrate reductase molybdenum cofactor assembly chaperone
MRNTEIHSLLSRLLSYPGSDFESKAERCSTLLRENYPDALSSFLLFARFACETTLASCQEIFVSTFEIQAKCSLDVGYVLFGEDYKRGALLVELTRVQREADNGSGTELPDHLTRLLSLFPRMHDHLECESIVRKLTLPAVEKMIESFENTENPYRQLLTTVKTVLEMDFGAAFDFPWELVRSHEEEVIHV